MASSLNKLPHNPQESGFLKTVLAVQRPITSKLLLSILYFCRKKAIKKHQNISKFFVNYSFSSSPSQICALASLGIRRSPLGDTATVPTLGPSGRQDRLNCWLKNRR